MFLRGSLILPESRGDSRTKNVKDIFIYLINKFIRWGLSAFEERIRITKSIFLVNECFFFPKCVYRKL